MAKKFNPRKNRTIVLPFDQEKYMNNIGDKKNSENNWINSSILSPSFFLTKSPVDTG